MSVFPAQTPPSQSGVALALKEKAKALFESGKMREAIDCYEEGASLHPFDPSWHLNACLLHLKLRDARACIAAADRALHVCSENDKASAAKARFRKGQGLILVGDALAARELLVMALADLPDHPQILAAIASIDARGLCSVGARAADGDGDGDGDGDASRLLPSKELLVKHGKKLLRVSYAPALGGTATWNTISRAFDLDPSKMKLLLRGSNLQPQHLIEQLEKARASDVVVAVGQVQEKEDGCDEVDIALLMRQLTVTREHAVKLLKRSGYSVIDAIRNAA